MDRDTPAFDRLEIVDTHLNLISKFVWNFIKPDVIHQEGKRHVSLR
jgi:hypothetical protein